MDDLGNNPYASPRSLGVTDESIAHSVRIPFSGTVRRRQLRDSLRTRISWSGIATFGIVSLICFAANPSSLAIPLFSGNFPSDADAMGELIGVIGLGFLILCVWHIIATCTHWGIDRREQAVLHYSPQLYDAPTQGYLDEDHVYLEQPNGKAWLSWDAIGLCQFAHELMIVDWTKGVVGNTVLTQEMFASAEEYQQATRLFAVQVNNPHRPTSQPRPAYLRVEETRSLKTVGQVLATVEQRGDLGTVVWTALLGIPAAIFRSSRPLHVFFGILMLLALVTTRQRIFVASTLFAVWAGILLVACVVAIVQNREFFFSRTPPLATRYTFFPDEIHLETAFAYFVIPMDRFHAVETNDLQFTVQQQRNHLALTFQADDFPTTEAFQQVRRLFN